MTDATKTPKKPKNPPKPKPGRESTNLRIAEAFNEAQQSIIGLLKVDSKKLTEMEVHGLYSVVMKNCAKYCSLIDFRDQQWNPDGSAKVKEEPEACGKTVV